MSELPPDDLLVKGLSLITLVIFISLLLYMLD